MPRRPPRPSRRARCAAAVLAIFCASGAAAQERNVSVFAGQHVNNSWQDIFDFNEQLDYDGAGLGGVAIGQSWRRRPESRLSWGIELQAVSQFGDQNHVEFNIPAVLRYDLPQPLPILRSVAFLLGMSYATEVPEYEVATRGESQQLMAYWAMEAEFGPADSRNSVFTRLHHRSGAFGTVADEGGSNAIVLGLRHRW